MKDRTLSTHEAADLLGCSVGKVRKMIRSGSLVVVKLNSNATGGYRIRRAEVESILSERKREAKKAAR
jgi:excisionase family DNA binding protein